MSRAGSSRLLMQLVRTRPSRCAHSRAFSEGPAARTAAARHVRDWAWLATGIAGGAAALYTYQSQEQPWFRSVKNESKAIVYAGSEARKAGKISAFELGQHKSPDSVWVAIDGDVWDVTEFLQLHPGGSQILIDNGGRDVSRLYKGIHPPGTLEKNLDESQMVGRLDEAAISKFAEMYNTEEARIEKARETLFGVDSVVTLNDFEKHAKELVPATAWEYFSTGVETETALKENASVYDRVFFRPRIMRDVRVVDTSAEILGVPVSIPVYVSPTARNALGQPLGEVAVTKGVAAGGILQVLSHVASKSLDEVLNARADGQKVGWQCYLKPDRSIAAKEIKRALDLGVQSIWITVDSTIVGKRDRERHAQVERQPAPHGADLTRGPAFKLSPRHDANLSWDDVKFVKANAPGIPVVVKGVGAWEDVQLAREAGADAVVLSNHGGRQLDFANPPLKTLYDLRQNAPQCIGQKDFQIFVDGGVRRGTDILKALCLGANAVGMGRPFIYAATGWGPQGVEKAIMILREEMEISMRLLGVTRLDQLGPEYLNCSKI